MILAVDISFHENPFDIITHSQGVLLISSSQCYVERTDGRVRVAVDPCAAQGRTYTSVRTGSQKLERSQSRLRIW